MITKYSNIKGYPGYYISKRGTLFTSLKRVGVKGKGNGRRGTTFIVSNNWKKKSKKYGYSRYFIHQVLKGIR